MLCTHSDCHLAASACSMHACYSTSSQPIQLFPLAGAHAHTLCTPCMQEGHATYPIHRCALPACRSADSVHKLHCSSCLTDNMYCMRAIESSSSSGRVLQSTARQPKCHMLARTTSPITRSKPVEHAPCNRFNTNMFSSSKQHGTRSCLVCSAPRQTVSLPAKPQQRRRRPPLYCRHRALPCSSHNHTLPFTEQAEPPKAVVRWPQWSQAP